MTPGSVLSGLYEVGERLGRGGMGEVFRARHLGWNQDLALKVPLGELGERMLASFRAEAEAWIGLEPHPNVATCHYVRMIDGRPVIFAEYADGGTLDGAIGAGRFAGDAGVPLLMQMATHIARGLGHAQAHGLVHQDVKPSNVLLTAGGTAKVADFGLARAMVASTSGEFGKPLSMSGAVTVMGLTPAYASPEQLAGKRVSGQTDVWSFGVVLLEMLIGDRTWQNGAAAGAALEEWLAEAESTHTRRLSPAIRDLLAACLSWEPEARPRLDEIERAIAAIGTSLGLEIAPLASSTDHRADWLHNRALSMIDLGREADASRIFDEVLRIDPEHVPATLARTAIGLDRGTVSQEKARAIAGALEACGDRGAVAAAIVSARIGDLARSWKLLADVKKPGRDAYGIHVPHGLASDLQRTVEDAEDALSRGVHPTAFLFARPQSGERLSEAARAVGALVDTIHAKLDRGDVAGAIDDLDFRDPISPRILEVARVVGRHAERTSAHSFRRWSADDAKGPQLTDDAKSVYGIIRGSVHAWDVWTGRELRVDVTPSNSLIALACNGTGERRIAIDAEGRVWSWEVHGTARLLGTHSTRGCAVAIDRNGQYALSAGERGVARLWNVPTGACSAELEVAGRIYSLALSRNGAWGVIGAASGIYLLDVRSRAARVVLDATSDVWSDVALSVDGRRLFSVIGLDLFTIDLRSGERTTFVTDPDDGIKHFALTRDEQTVVTQLENGTARLWDARVLGGKRFFASERSRAEDAMLVEVSSGRDGIALAEDLSGFFVGGVFHELGWNYRARAGGEWDRRAQPLIEDAILRRHPTLEEARAAGATLSSIGGERTLRELMDDCARTGWGWFDENEVRRALESVLTGAV